MSAIATHACSRIGRVILSARRPRKALCEITKLLRTWINKLGRLTDDAVMSLRQDGRNCCAPAAGNLTPNEPRRTHALGEPRDTAWTNASKTSLRTRPESA